MAENVDDMIVQGMKTGNKPFKEEPAEPAQEQTEAQETVDTQATTEESTEAPKAQEGQEAQESATTEQTTEAAESTEQQASTETETPIFEIFNQKFDTEFKDESELKLALDASKRSKELEEQLKDFESLKEENLLLKENMDPVKLFGSEDRVRNAMFEKQFPDKNPAVAHELFSTDLKEMSPKALLAKNVMLNTPGLSEQDAMAYIDKKYGIDEEGEQEPADKTAMRVDANSATREIESLRSQVQMPEKFDAESISAQQKELRAQKTEQLKGKWDNIAKEVIRTFPDVEVSDKDAEGNEWSFKYSIAKDFPEEVADEMVNYMANHGVEADENALQTMYRELEKEMLYRNKDNLIKAVREDILAKAEEQRLKKQHNPGESKPANDPSKGGGGDDVDSKIAAAIEKRTVRSNPFS